MSLMINLGTMINLVRNLIKRAVITLKADDSQKIPTVQCSYLGDTITAELVNPYGISAIPPVGENAITWSVLAQEDNIAAMPTSTSTRLRGMQAGEVAVGNFTNDTYAYFNQNETILIIANDVIISPRGKRVLIEDILEVNQYFTSLDPAAKPIARVDDLVQVDVPGVGIVQGTIITGSPNAKVT